MEVPENHVRAAGAVEFLTSATEHLGEGGWSTWRGGGAGKMEVGAREGRESFRVMGRKIIRRAMIQIITRGLWLDCGWTVVGLWLDCG